MLYLNRCPVYQEGSVHKSISESQSLQPTQKLLKRLQSKNHQPNKTETSHQNTDETHAATTLHVFK